MERYCSSYLDRNGLYNDGFPCPGKTYCCEKEDGTKMCCAETANANVQKQLVTKPAYISPILSELVATTKSSSFYQNNLEQFNNRVGNLNTRFENVNNNNKEYLQPTDGFIRTPSNISLLMSKYVLKKNLIFFKICILLNQVERFYECVCISLDIFLFL